MNTVILNGWEYNIEEIIASMDKDIYVDLIERYGEDISSQTLTDLYCIHHNKKHHEVFVV